MLPLLADSGCMNLITNVCYLTQLYPKLLIMYWIEHSVFSHSRYFHCPITYWHFLSLQLARSQWVCVIALHLWNLTPFSWSTKTFIWRYTTQQQHRLDTPDLDSTPWPKHPIIGYARNCVLHHLNSDLEYTQVLYVSSECCYVVYALMNTTV